MSRVFKDFVDVLKKLHGPDLAALGVSLQWELLLLGGERISGFGLSKLGIGMDRGAGVLYFGVEFSAENLVAPPGQSAKTKTAIRRDRAYKGVQIGFIGLPVEGAREPVRVLPESAIYQLLRELGPLGGASIVGPFNGWGLGRGVFVQPSGKDEYWGFVDSGTIDQGTEAKVAISLPAGWTAEWDSGHHAPGVTQILTLWPPEAAA